MNHTYKFRITGRRYHSTSYDVCTSFILFFLDNFYKLLYKVGIEILIQQLVLINLSNIVKTSNQLPTLNIYFI